MTMIISPLSLLKELIEKLAFEKDPMVGVCSVVSVLEDDEQRKESSERGHFDDDSKSSTMMSLMQESLLQHRQQHQHPQQQDHNKKIQLMFPGEGFTQATVVKPTIDTPLGISYKQNRPGDWRIVLTRIHPNGALLSALLVVREEQSNDDDKTKHRHGCLSSFSYRPGQTILGVNGQLTKDMKSAKELTIFLKSLTTPRVCILATNSVVATVFKPTRNTKVGIAFCQRPENTRRKTPSPGDDTLTTATTTTTTTDHVDENENHNQKNNNDEAAVWIFRLTPGGLFDETGILNVGMKVLAINDQPCPQSLEETSRMITESSIGYLSILAIDDHASSPLSTTSGSLPR